MKHASSPPATSALVAAAVLMNCRRVWRRDMALREYCAKQLVRQGKLFEAMVATGLWDHGLGTQRFEKDKD